MNWSEFFCFALHIIGRLQALPVHSMSTLRRNVVGGAALSGFNPCRARAEIRELQFRVVGWHLLLPLLPYTFFSAHIRNRVFY